VALRATFIVDPDNTIQHASVNNLSVGRSPQELLRVLDGLQTRRAVPEQPRAGRRHSVSAARRAPTH
jgi:alkyl hydroperoxide reductase subunit AhpC